MRSWLRAAFASRYSAAGPYDVNDFTGWCVVTSLFLNQYPGIENTSLQRLIRTEKHPTEENMIILHDWT